MFGLPKEAAGAILAALIAGLVSLLGLIISKEQKISEFRQAWIDGLRENVALVITHIEAIRGAMHAARPAQASWQDRKEHFVAINQAITCVRLRLDNLEPSSRELLSSLTELEDIAQAGDIATSQLVGPAIDKLTERCRLVMQEEWKRVRDGELTYRLARLGSVTAVGIALALLIGIVSRSLLSERPQFHAAGDDVQTRTAGHGAVRLFATPCAESGFAQTANSKRPGSSPARENPAPQNARARPGQTPLASRCIQIRSGDATIQILDHGSYQPR